MARAAFSNGYEAYGWDIIQRFMKLIERDHTAYFLYCPDSSPQPHGGPSAWGAAALLYAVDEGLAGVEDIGVRYDEMRFSPRFPVTDYKELRYVTGYECTGTLVDVRYIIKDEGMRYDVYAPTKKMHAHILLPNGKKCAQLRIDGQVHDFDCTIVGESNYVDVTLEHLTNGKVSFEVLFQRK